MEMKESGLMEKKMHERLRYAIDMVKEESKKEGIEFDKSLFLASVEIAKTLLVRSEIAYSGRKG